ncbi:MAG: ATP-dependent sacrificial sulfur transferase LarE [Gemmataceae bacterium]
MTLVPEKMETASLGETRDRLLAWFKPFQSVAVAFSGGIDSTLVAKAAHLAKGDSALAFTADSPSVPRTELEEASRLAKLIGIRHEILPTAEFSNPDYLRNDGSRCFHCKDELYARIVERTGDLGVEVILSGANRDDAGDYRPGLRAASEHGVRHPLLELGIGKQEVRELARHWDLPTWNKPASPCLSSRLAPGVAVTPERTARIEAAERFLRDLPLPDCRVRLHENELARIEVPLEHLHRLANPSTREDIARRFKALGFRFITLDLEGFRSGSMNELIPLELKSRYQG